MIIVFEEELLLLLFEIDEIKLLGIGEFLLVNIDLFVNVVDEKIGMKGCCEINMML